jgi:DNA-binding CsgD family transcriptional regulator
MSDDEKVALSPRQLACLDLLSRGNTIPEAARELGISPRTVEQHLGDACSRLGVRTRIEAIVIAVRQGLIPVDRSV